MFGLLAAVYFITTDELVLGNSQRRKGPLNVGWYGIISAIVNGINLVITQGLSITYNLEDITALVVTTFCGIAFLVLTLTYPMFTTDLHCTVLVLVVVFISWFELPGLLR